MENGNFLEKIASLFSQSVSVKNEYGDPVQVGAKTIIPVARIAYGPGGGHGQAGKRNERPQPEGDLKRADDASGEDAGGGDGIYARAQGVYEITPAGTRFIVATRTKQLLMGIAIGFLVRSWFYSKRRNKKNP